MSRIPPLDERLRFVRNTKAGRVHILPWVDGHIERALPGPRDVSFAEVVNQLAGRQPMLCGASLIVGPDDDWPAVRVGSFADDDLCIACVRAMGEQSWRAFHVDNRGSEDPDE